MFGRLWTSYNAALEKNPMLIKAMTSLTGFTLGDILAQKFVMPDEEKGYDLMRTVRLGSFGFLIHGPTGHYFYSWLDKQIPGTAMKTVATKVAIDQLLWNPCFGVMFFSYLGLAEGKSFADIQTKIKNDLSTAVVGSWTVWIPAHFVNFRFVPSSQRLVCNLGGRGREGGKGGMICLFCCCCVEENGEKFVSLVLLFAPFLD